MMGRARADLGFTANLDDFDPADWAVGTPAPQRPEDGTARVSAEASGFRSREVREARTPQPSPDAGAGGKGRPRRRRTGRNAQFNLKARPETIEQFCAVADAQGWGLGETLEQAVVLLERAFGATSPVKTETDQENGNRSRD
jgi:hypothetical protein|tara:strand:+ start:10761 stop:11186 length:426 start_codon:yes stop_codon:yes gene_type:complete